MVTKIMLNFQKFLESSLPFLAKAGVSQGDDDWDDFSELAFEILVDEPLRSQYGRHAKWKYEAIWSGNESKVSQIWATTQSAESLLLGREEGEKLGCRVPWEEKPCPKTPVRFEFWGFNHPFKEEGVMDWVRSVEGIVTDENQIYPIGTIICAPLESCKFSVEESPLQAG